MRLFFVQMGCFILANYLRVHCNKICSLTNLACSSQYTCTTLYIFSGIHSVDFVSDGGKNIMFAQDGPTLRFHKKIAAKAFRFIYIF